MTVALWLLVGAVVLLCAVLDHGLTEITRAIYSLNGWEYDTQPTAAESCREER